MFTQIGQTKYLLSMSVKLLISDHYAIFGNRRLNISERKNAHQTITYRSFKHFDVEAFRNELFDAPWEIIENFTNVNDMVQVWNSLFLEIVNKYAHIKRHRVKKSRQLDWLDPDILDTIKERNNAKLMVTFKTINSYEIKYLQ